MKYSDILSFYEPEETGDFFYRYKINEREYIIYSPEQGSLSCLELYNFKDLTPYQLIMSIQGKLNVSSGLGDLRVERTCSKENLIKYMFNIDKEEEGSLIKRGDKYGYILHDMKSLDKARNIYMFDPEKQESTLLFDNDLCYASFFEDVPADTMNLCWSPIVFNSLRISGIKRPSFLLPSTNPILCAYINSIAKNKKFKINFCDDKNILSALKYFSFYMESIYIEKKITVFSESNNVTVLMRNWHPTSVVRFISSVQKKYNNKFDEVYEIEQERRVETYILKYADDMPFVIFPNLDLAISIFLESLIKQLGADDIFNI